VSTLIVKSCVPLILAGSPQGCGRRTCPASLVRSGATGGSRRDDSPQIPVPKA